MTIGEIVLKLLSRDPDIGDYPEDALQSGAGNELALLAKEFGDLGTRLEHKKIVDFGCGEGRQAIALAREVNAFVCGIDSNEKTLQRAKRRAQAGNLGDDRIQFKPQITEEMHAAFDIVISQNAMEHFEDPEAVLREMKRLIHDNGEIWITFGPPWMAPFGSHMYFFCRVPWLNLLFSEKTVLKVRSRYRKDGATRYEEVESGLNRMTVGKFERIAAGSGLRIVRKKYNCVKGLDWLGTIPLLRELFINHITCILTKEISPDRHPEG
jgi:ubiquinone/menaquinone biosynthesis C-methylase UbiE